jgi:hypothetical protein
MWKLLLFGALLGAAGSVINGDWVLIVVFVIMGLGAVTVVRRASRQPKHR